MNRRRQLKSRGISRAGRRIRGKATEDGGEEEKKEEKEESKEEVEVSKEETKEEEKKEEAAPVILNNDFLNDIKLVDLPDSDDECYF